MWHMHAGNVLHVRNPLGNSENDENESYLKHLPKSQIDVLQSYREMFDMADSDGFRPPPPLPNHECIHIHV